MEERADYRVFRDEIYNAIGRTIGISEREALYSKIPTDEQRKSIKEKGEKMAIESLLSVLRMH